MKRLIIYFLFSFFVFSNAYAKNFNQTIQKYLENNKGNTEMVYAFNRCAAVFTYVATKLFNEPNQKERALNLVKLSSKSSELAAGIHSKYNKKTLNESLRMSESRMMELDKLYRQDGEEYFNKNGRFFSPVILDDLQYCTKEIVELINSGY